MDTMSNTATAPATSSVRRGISLVATGSHFEMGYAQGTQLRDSILSALETCSRQEIFRQEQPRWMPLGAFLWLARMKAKRLLSEPLSRDFFEIHERLRGMAVGTGFGLPTMYLANAVEPLMCSVTERSVVPSLAACTAVAVRGRRSSSGEPIIARNFDYASFVQPYFIVRESRPDSGYRSLDFTIATMCGSVDCVNESGLCVTYNYAYTSDAVAPAGTVSMIINEALERCSTVAEAAEWISSRPRWGGAILMLADADGDIASLELSNTRSRLRRPKDGEDILFHTNHFQSAGMRQVEVSDRAVFSDRAHSVLRGRRVLESAETRSSRLGRLLAGDARLAPSDLATVLADHGPSETPGVNTLCVHSDYQCTNACLQLFPKSRKMRISYSSACQADFEDIQL